MNAEEKAMRVTLAGELAEKLMSDFGLTVLGWRFRWSFSKSAAGCCIHDKKVIELSVHFAEVRTEAMTEDTIRHEIAHALVGRGYGHGWVWKSKAVECGANPVACFSDAYLRKGFEALCPKCGFLDTFRSRMPKSTRVCKKCRSVVSWYKVDQKKAVK